MKGIVELVLLSNDLIDVIVKAYRQAAMENNEVMMITIKEELQKVFGEDYDLDYLLK